MDLAKRFPFLNHEERACIASFEQGSISADKVVELMLTLSDAFREAATQQDRAAARAKLLGLAGLYEVIPVEKFQSARNAPLSTTLLELRLEGDEEPLRALMRCGEVPLDILVNFPGFKEFFMVRKPDGTSYQEHLLRKHCSIGGILIALKENINEEVSGYVSASSEPLTRCILLNPWSDGPKKEMRDFASMTYDIIMQVEFLHIFYSSQDVLQRSAVQATMRLEGLRFLFDTFAKLLERAIDGKHVEIEITPSEAKLINKGGKDGIELCNYLIYLLYGLGLSTIEQVTQVLGFQRSELEIGKLLLEHELKFDPRRVRMLIA